jgi:AbiV family abortive infection protein
MAKPDQTLFAALEACVVHARDLLESAKIVQQSGRANVAYHLATLALEEMGKRELYKIQNAATAVGEPPKWQSNATQDHTKKLFWCFYSFGGIPEVVDQKIFFDKQEAAADIHANRMAGLYVESSDGSLNIPADAVSNRQSLALIGLAETLIGYAESEKPRDDIPKEEIDLQVWFLNAFDDPEKRNRILTTDSLARLKALNDAVEWTRSIKAQLEAEDEELRLLAERELRRQPMSGREGAKKRWKIQLRIETASHSIRAASLREWNEKIDWIKLSPQQGAKKKEQLLVELSLGDDVPIAALWGFGFTLSLQFLVAINMATSGFWWWPLAPNHRRFYESIRDLESGHNVEVDGSGFQVFNRERPKLTEVHLRNTLLCLTSLPDPYDPKRGPAFTGYLGGLVFISLNCIQWRCEAQAFTNFLISFKTFMIDASYLLEGEAVESAIGRFLAERFPELDQAEHVAFVKLVAQFEQNAGASTVTLGDVYLIKLLCETIFRDEIVPDLRRRSKPEDVVTEPNAPNRRS